MKRQKTVAEPRGITEDDFMQQVAGVIQYNVKADISSRRYRTALARAARLTKWKPEDPIYKALLADAYCALGARSAEPRPEELTGKGLSDARKRFLNRTAEEEERELLATAPGKEAIEGNRKKAEQLYREAISQNPELAEPHRGLGMLMESCERVSEAAEAYKEYLRLAPEATDRLRIQRRLENLEKPRLLHRAK